MGEPRSKTAAGLENTGWFSRKCIDRISDNTSAIADLAVSRRNPDIPGGRRAMANLFTLVPYHAKEGMSVPDAAKVAGKSDRTIRD